MNGVMDPRWFVPINAECKDFQNISVQKMNGVELSSCQTALKSA